MLLSCTKMVTLFDLLDLDQDHIVLLSHGWLSLKLAYFLLM